jgi:hypothetical protein
MDLKAARCRSGQCVLFGHDRAICRRGQGWMSQWGGGKKLEVRLIESFEEILFVQALPSPTLHKRREGWGSRCLGASAGVESLGHPPNLTRSARRFRSTSRSEQPSRGLSHASPVQCHSQWEEKRAAPPPVDRPKSTSALKTYLRWHSHFPPFAKDAKDGAPVVLPMPGNIKKLGHPTRKSF